MCDTARMFAAVMQWYFLFFVLCNEAAYLFGWAATGYAFNFWAGALSVLGPVFLLTFRRRYFLVGYVVSFFLAFVLQVPRERWAILYEKSLNLKTISQGNLATLERII